MISRILNKIEYLRGIYANQSLTAYWLTKEVKIAAGAVVVKDVLEPGCTVAGIPAVVVKHSI